MFSLTHSTLSKILFEAAGSIDVILREKELALFEEYYRNLLFWNNKINLVSIKSDIDVPIKHFIDSLTPLRFIENKRSSLLDIGTGAGFPGIPMKIAADQLNIFLLDSSRKKTVFLKNLVRKLHLDDTTIINNRAELFISDEACAEAFDIVISRATFKLPQFLKIGAPYVHAGGRLIAMKGGKIDAEEKQAEEICRSVRLKYTACHEIRLPVTQDTRKILIFEKEHETREPVKK